MIASALGRVLPADRLSWFCWSRGNRLNLGAGSPACQAVRCDNRQLFANSGRLLSDVGSGHLQVGSGFPPSLRFRLRAEAAAGLAAIRLKADATIDFHAPIRRSFLDAALLAELDD